ncbi:MULTISPECIES: helix-turn-helix domain-containing protein [Protofrankia]|uniref:Helix-turn-helix domain-containing protein n=1 Tax=Protofrankia coriariae TaxID=1562887 RepID=A0ABR5F2C0_9ACTN|nr:MULTISPECIES: helix-turn-helix domain-containing protein [Protofrankia]KLL10820.1 hypothetical protein FrCorBMG51_15495 [Protofrankia coriariae]ONH34022.1 hypothetical protein BL254_18460 [Protofrankia sp. BMG5.30]
MDIVPRRALASLYAHVRALTLTPAGGVSVRSLRAVLVALVAFLDAETWSGAFPSMATLAARAECSDRTARRAVRALEAAGVLAVELGGGRRSNRYRLIRPDGGPAASADPVPVSGQPGHAGRRSPVSTSRTPFGRTRRRAREATGQPVPDDLRPLADALHARGLRAAYGLDDQQADGVRATLARVGVAAMVQAAYRAHRATDPARWWSAWTGLWTGLHVPSSPATATPTPTVPRSAATAAAGLAACRSALAARHAA